MSQDAYRLISPAGKELELPVRTGTTGPDVIDIGSLYKEHGVFTYDPGFVATGSCESDITYIDGEKGVLMYRGYPVEQLAKHSLTEIANRLGVSIAKVFRRKDKIVKRLRKIAENLS